MNFTSLKTSDSLSVTNSALLTGQTVQHVEVVGLGRLHQTGVILPLWGGSPAALEGDSWQRHRPAQRQHHAELRAREFTCVCVHACMCVRACYSRGGAGPKVSCSHLTSSDTNLSFVNCVTVSIRL